MLEIRDRSERELDVTFHVHSDACYGGYAAALTRKADGTRRSAAEIRGGAGSDWPDADWVSSIAALGQADSVSIDPHKMGYVPYSAGAILVRDGRTRHLVATDPPYLTPPDAVAPTIGALPRTVHPGGIEAWRCGRRSVAQPQGASAQ